MFGIFFEDENSPFDNGYGKHLLARIQLGEYSEELHIPVDYWSSDEYKRNWKKSLATGLEKRDHSLLITSMHDPVNLNFFSSWVIYYDKENSFVQNKIIFLEDFPKFDLSMIENYIGIHEIINEDGFRISEWVVKTEDVISFYNEL